MESKGWRNTASRAHVVVRVREAADERGRSARVDEPRARLGGMVVVDKRAHEADRCALGPRARPRRARAAVREAHERLQRARVEQARARARGSSSRAPTMSAARARARSRSA